MFLRRVMCVSNWGLGRAPTRELDQLASGKSLQGLAMIISL